MPRNAGHAIDYLSHRRLNRAVLARQLLLESLPLVDGQVAGTWRHEPGGITLQAFAPPAPAARRDVEAEAHQLEACFTKTDGGQQ